MSATATAAEKPWALITGASAGIGEAFTRLLAQEGYNIVLVARREARLRELAQQLEAHSSCHTLCIAVDLADINASDIISDRLLQKDIVVSVLVNNAGFGLPGKFHEHEWPVHQAYNQLMVNAVLELTHRLLPAMQAQKQGRIINVASVAGLAPGSSGHSLYAASKAYLIRFSESIHFENLERNVYCCALCPGFTYSEFHDVTGTRDKVSALPNFMWQDAGTVAHAGFKAVMQGKPICVAGWWNRCIDIALGLLPRALIYRSASKASQQYRNTNTPDDAS